MSQEEPLVEDHWEMVDESFSFIIPSGTPQARPRGLVGIEPLLPTAINCSVTHLILLTFSSCLTSPRPLQVPPGTTSLISCLYSHPCLTLALLWGNSDWGTPVGF